MSEKNNDLFNGEVPDAWHEEWRGMPEFKISDLSPVHSIQVNFDSPEAVVEFSKLIGQKVTMKTKFIVFPPRDNRLKDVVYKSDY